jgi:hypothetical protein
LSLARDRFIVAFIALGLGAAACWAFASQFENSDHVLGFIGMIGLASLLVGALAGFLFGVPRWAASGGEPGRTAGRGEFIPNTNLEQVSDWLTKILVGVGLTQFRAIGSAFGRLLTELKPGFGNGDDSAAFAGGLIIYATAVGFIAGYVFTAIFLRPVLPMTSGDRISDRG